MSLIPRKFKAPEFQPARPASDAVCGDAEFHRTKDYRHFHDYIHHRVRGTLLANTNQVFLPIKSFKSVNMRSMNATLIVDNIQHPVKIRIKTRGVMLTSSTVFDCDHFINLRFETNCLGAI